MPHSQDYLESNIEVWGGILLLPTIIQQELLPISTYPISHMQAVKFIETVKWTSFGQADMPTYGRKLNVDTNSLMTYQRPSINIQGH